MWAAGFALIASAACQPAPDFVVGEIEFRAAEGSMAPNLVADGDRAVLSWLEPADSGRHALRVALREDGAWRTAGTIVENDSLFVNWADFPSVLVLPDGRWIAHWLQKTAPATYAYHVRMAVSHDRGASWGEPFTPHSDRSPTEHGFVAMVQWDDGAALIWLDGRNTGAGAGRAAGAAGAAEGSGGGMTVRFTTIDGSGIPAPDVEIDGRVCDCCQTDLARTADGLVAVYRDRSLAEIRDIAVSRFRDGAWTPPTQVADDGWHYNACPVNGPAVAAAGDTVIVTWFSAAQGPTVSAAVSTDGGATFGDPVRIDEGRPTGRVDAIMSGGSAVVSWIEETDDAGEIRIRRIAADGRSGRFTTVARTTTARAAGFPRLLRLNDELLVAWTEPGAARGVRVATVRVGG